MPKLNVSKMVTTESGFQFSGEQLEDLGSDVFTLVNISADSSYSTQGFEEVIRKAVAKVILDCSKMPMSKSILIRVCEFSGYDVQEIVGFTQVNKLLSYDWSAHFQSSGSTPLHDATIEGIEACSNYGQKLQESYYQSNALNVVITDGEENTSRKYPYDQVSSVADQIEKIKMKETLDSLKTILVGLNRDSDSSMTTYLDRFFTNTKIDQYVEAKDSDSTDFARLGGFISQSVSSTSQQLGSGQPSANLSF